MSIRSLSQDKALGLIQGALEAGRHLKVAFANSHVVNLAATEPGFSDALHDFAVLPDGIGVDLGSKLLYGTPFAANLNGTDFIPWFVANAGRPITIGLIGAKPGVAERAMAKLQRHASQHRYRVYSDGFFQPDQEPELLASLELDRPDLLLVAMGNPRQELWIARKLTQKHCSVAVGVGALFDFLAGEVVRAPRWLRNLRMEWLFRLAQEPVRLWQRYVLGNPVFLMRILVQKWRRAP